MSWSVAVEAAAGSVDMDERGCVVGLATGRSAAALGVVIERLVAADREAQTLSASTNTAIAAAMTNLPFK